MRDRTSILMTVLFYFLGWIFGWTASFRLTLCVSLYIFLINGTRYPFLTDNFFLPFFLRRPLISSRANKSKANTLEVFASVFAFIYISNYLVRCIRSSCWLVHYCCNMSDTQPSSDRKSIFS